jgi:hypothetical protein
VSSVDSTRSEPEAASGTILAIQETEKGIGERVRIKPGCGECFTEPSLTVWVFRDYIPIAVTRLLLCIVVLVLIYWYCCPGVSAPVLMRSWVVWNVDGYRSKPWS